MRNTDSSANIAVRLQYRKSGILAMLIIVLGSGCATTQSLVDSPRVRLTDVEMTHAGFSGQTFMLRFDVANPNPFPLSVTEVRYQIILSDERFASGEVSSEFSIPAGGNGDFDVQVELDLLRQASSLVSVVRTGMRHHVEYEVHGSLSVDIPFVQPIPFSSTGSIKIGGNAF